MNYSECIENARTRIGNYCKACPECNGRACKNQMPGPGAKGIGDTAIRNYDKWKEIRVQMDTIAETNRWIHPWSSSERSFYIHFLQDRLVQWDYITATAWMM